MDLGGVRRIPLNRAFSLLITDALTEPPSGSSFKPSAEPPSIKASTVPFATYFDKLH